MYEFDITTEYRNWIRDLAIPNKLIQNNYSKLLNKLECIEFTYTYPNDKNRYLDGINLRYRFGKEFNIDYDTINIYLDTQPCSILEMMVALAFKIEEHIMSDPEIGDRTGLWFSEMLNSLHISCMEDFQYDSTYIEEQIECFLNHNYESNGSGGLFTVPGITKDMRDMEIWYQMSWYLNSLEEN